MSLSNGHSFAEKVLEAIARVTGPGPVSLHEPEFSGNEWLYLKRCLDSTFVSSVGEFVNRFEDELAEYTGAKHAIAVVNGSAGLHIALKLAGVIAGDEVLVPALTFIATANAVSYCSAQPHFVDSDISTFGMDAVKLRRYLEEHTQQSDGQCVNLITGRVVRAMVPVHIFGHPAAMDELMSVASDHGINVVEDAAESLGSYYRGRHTGTLGQLGVLSFNGNKTITSGGGGAILTNDTDLALRARHLTTTAKLRHAWEYHHDEIGYNYRMPNLNAALACAQLEQLDGFCDLKRVLYQRYCEAFECVPGLELVSEAPHSRSNYWLQALVLDDEHSCYRDEILELTNAAGYMTRPVWSLLTTAAPYSDCPSMDVSGATKLARSLINIPSSAHLAGRCFE